MRAELLGGPRDGDVVTLRQGAREFRLALMSPRAWFVPGQPTASSARIGIYRARDNPNELHWLGVECDR